MAIFGTDFPIISGSSKTILLEHAKMNPSFLMNEVIEFKGISGHLSYPFKVNKSSFEIDVLLCNYPASESLGKFNDLYSIKDLPFKFFPHGTESASGSMDEGKNLIDYHITEFVPYYLSGDERYDGVKLLISPTKNSKLFTHLQNGYGFNYSNLYGVGL